MAKRVPPPSDKPTNPDKPFHPCAPSDFGLFATAPVVMSFQRVLPVSPERLFDVFEDPTSWSRWAHGVGNVVWTSPPPHAVGTTRTVYLRGGMEVYEDFIRWERGREMALVLYGATRDVFERFGEHYLVQPMEGGCRLTWTVAFEPSAAATTALMVLRPALKASLSSSLRRLGRTCAKLDLSPSASPRRGGVDPGR